MSMIHVYAEEERRRYTAPNKTSACISPTLLDPALPFRFRTNAAGTGRMQSNISPVLDSMFWTTLPIHGQNPGNNKNIIFASQKIRRIQNTGTASCCIFAGDKTGANKNYKPNQVKLDRRFGGWGGSNTLDTVSIL